MQEQETGAVDAPVTKKRRVENPCRDIRFAAMSLLARREQSFHELLTKLGNKFLKSEHHPPELIKEQLLCLRNEGLQNDQRFVTSFVNSKKNSGKGPNAVRHQLQQKGVSGDLIAMALKVVADEWQDLAQQLYERKYGESHATNLKDKAKRMRFMHGRGFSPEHYSALLK
ncbi:MAG: regulatory protein [Pseudohongiellaceae bacterium]|jgi:regulatory protein